jgi:hypothetical protein
MSSSLAYIKNLPITVQLEDKLMNAKTRTKENLINDGLNDTHEDVVQNEGK